MRVGVASSDGALVNARLGNTPQVFIFEVSLRGIEYVEKRDNPPWWTDCKVLLTSQCAGDVIDRFSETGQEVIVVPNANMAEELRRLSEGPEF